jgi:ketosteroid isomerase-like protein
MRTATSRALVAATGLLLTSCNKAADSKVDAEKQIRDIESQWQSDYDTKNVDALVAHYADDAALANPGAAIATDAVSRRQGISDFVADPAMKLQFSSDRIEVAASGDLASSRGHYTMTMTDPVTKKPFNSNGSYLTVYRKQADGSWKAVEDFVTPGAAEPASN